jgi:hypothetical protein
MRNLIAPSEPHADQRRNAANSAHALTIAVLVIYAVGPMPAEAATTSTAFGVSATVPAHPCTVIVDRTVASGLGLEAEPISVICAVPTDYRLSRHGGPADFAPDEAGLRGEQRSLSARARSSDLILAFLTF